jgi:hypothetical protein
MAETEDNRRQRKRASNRAWAAANREKRQEYMRQWRNANRAAINAQNREWLLANLEKAKAYRRNKYAKECAKQPFQRAYKDQRYRAFSRGVPFLLTFGEWTSIWLESGKWEQRGRRRGQYVMARFKDVGAYAVGNVYICEAGVNAGEANYAKRGKSWSDERRDRFEAKRRHLLPA